MKCYFLFLAFFIPVGILAQTTPNPVNQRPELQSPLSVIAPSQLSTATAAAQLSNWRSAVKMNPGNEEAWFNYYLWASRDKEASASEKKSSLEDILQHAAENISNRSLFFLLKYLHSDKKDTTSLLQAAALQQNMQIVYPYLVQHYSATKNKAMLHETCKALDLAQPLSLSMFKYHYNVLMSADSNAVIFTRGLNDLVPMLTLQEVYQIRNDINIKSLQSKTEIKKGDYLCLSMGKDFLSGFPTASYTGLLIKNAGKVSFDELKNHVEKHFDLSQQQFNDTEPGVIQLQKNYLPSFILLYRHYVQAQDQRQYAMKAIIDKIAALAGITAEVQAQMNK